MQNEFRGEAIYTAENDVHFPMLTVGQTLYFAARARAPREIPGGVSKDVYAQHLRDVVMATFGILILWIPMSAMTLFAVYLAANASASPLRRQCCRRHLYNAGKSSSDSASNSILSNIFKSCPSLFPFVVDFVAKLPYDIDSACAVSTNSAALLSHYIPYGLRLIRDNSTRGLDAANAIEFAKTLRMSTELSGATACVSIYQAS